MPHLPSGYSARPVRVEDAAAIVEMLNLESQATIGEPQFTAGEYAIDLQEPGFNLEEQSRIVLAPDGSVAGVVELYAQPPYVRNFGWVRVHPNHTGRGLGTALTEWAESRVRASQHKAPEKARVKLESSTFSANTVAQALLADLGFQQVRTFYSMRIEMDAPPPAPFWPEGISVRTLIPGEDDRAAYQVVDEAFSDHWGHVPRPFEEGLERWQHHLFSDPTFDPTLQFLAVEGNEVVGVSICSAAPDGSLDVGWVNQLGVRRAWRQRGLAQALLLHTFGEFYRRGTTKVGLGVDADSLTGATRLYEKVGMSVHHAHSTFHKEIRPGVELALESLDD